ncbi:MAG: very short patch repair endonuclease [Candidatus Omnitrophica bacterium]|nr:very short patch repair endonuclease [Candidatus Omnitrophota bacterium]MDD5351714.1 very short patch repair endonuclease [Candidatus Omnitrophota bacterium]MDD5550924.1 very short patch repair endonuclease [Candidatus Omnitrophota bacterium]
MDRISKEARSRNMAAIKGTNTIPEMAVRRMLYSLGYRYRLHKKNLPGKPDIFIKNRNAAIFVNGCFWHQHPNCRFATKPKSNRRFWMQKLKKNIKRDRENLISLKELGYKIISIWECEIGKQSIGMNQRLVKRLIRSLG